LKPLIAHAISTLAKMIDPPSEEWEFVDIGEGGADVVKAVEEQVDALKRD